MVKTETIVENVKPESAYFVYLFELLAIRFVKGVLDPPHNQLIQILIDFRVVQQQFDNGLMHYKVHTKRLRDAYWKSAIFSIDNLSVY